VDRNSRHLSARARTEKGPGEEKERGEVWDCGGISRRGQKTPGIDISASRRRLLKYQREKNAGEHPIGTNQVRGKANGTPLGQKNKVKIRARYANQLMSPSEKEGGKRKNAIGGGN